MNPVGITIIFIGLFIALHAVKSDWAAQLAGSA